MERTRTDVTPALVDKALGSVRAGTKKKGAELCCMYVEVENSGEGVVVSRGFRMMDVKLTTV
jgi:cytoskeleton-associated protein 5